MSAEIFDRNPVLTNQTLWSLVWIDTSIKENVDEKENGRGDGPQKRLGDNNE